MAAVTAAGILAASGNSSHFNATMDSSTRKPGKVACSPRRFRDPTADEAIVPHTQIQIDQSETGSKHETEAADDDEEFYSLTDMEPETIPIYDIRLLNHRRHHRYNGSRSLPISLAVTPMSEIDGSSAISSQWVIIADPVRPAGSTSLSYLSSRRSSQTLNSAAHFEEAFSKAGGFHNYQLRVLLVLCLTSLYCGPPLFIWNFLKPVPRHRCRVPSDDHLFGNASESRFYYSDLEKYIPTKNFWSSELNSCKKFDLRSSNNSILVPCDEYIYDTSDKAYMKTPVIEYDLVCDKAWIWKVAPLMFMIGTLVGAFFMGITADRFGRRSALLSSMIMMTLGELLELIIPNPKVYMVVVGITGMGVMGTLQTAFLLAMELVGSSQRRPVGFTFYIFFFMGYFISTFYAYFIRDWKVQKAALLLPGIAFITYWWILPESAQWLLTKGRTKEAGDMLSRVAQVNKGLDAGSIIFENKPNGDILIEEHKKSTGCHDILTSSQPRNAFIVVFVIMLLIGIGPVATRMYFQLYDNIYSEFLLNGGLEIAGCVVGILFSPFFGRRQLFLVCSLLVSGAFLLIAILTIYDEWELFWIRIIAWKIFISTAVCNLRVMAAELFPTRARGTCLSVCTVLMGVGEFINIGVRVIIERERGRYGALDKDPYVFYGFVSAAAGLLVLLLPEMYNKPMPHTFSDCKDFTSYESDFGGLIKIMQKIHGAKQNQRVQEILEQKRRESRAAAARPGRRRPGTFRTVGRGESSSTKSGSREGASSQQSSSKSRDNVRVSTSSTATTSFHQPHPYQPPPKPKRVGSSRAPSTSSLPEEPEDDLTTLDAMSDDFISKEDFLEFQGMFAFGPAELLGLESGFIGYPIKDPYRRRRSSVSSKSEEMLDEAATLVRPPRPLHMGVATNGANNGSKRKQRDLGARLAESKLEAKRKRRDSCSVDDYVSVTEMRDQQTQATVENVSLASLNENDL